MNATEATRATAGGRHRAGPGLLARAVSSSKTEAPHPPFGHPLPAGEGRGGPSSCWLCWPPSWRVRGRIAPRSAGRWPAIATSSRSPDSTGRPWIACAPTEFGPARWNALLRVVVRPGAGPASDRRSMLGSYRVEDGLVRFRPRFPLERGLTYEAVFDPSKLPGAGDRTPDAPPIVAPLTLEAPSNVATTSLVRVDPAVATLPENLLKFYLTFSAPMSRGQAYDRVHLLDASGKAIDFPFLELGEELWDPSGTRLTLLFDPGRIKTGLKPREEAGPALEAGKSYTLVVDEAWPDAQGRPLLRGIRKPFRVGPADHTSPDPASWTIRAPKGRLTRPPPPHPHRTPGPCPPGPAGHGPRPGRPCPPRSHRDRGRRAPLELPPRRRLAGGGVPDRRGARPGRPRRQQRRPAVRGRSISGRPPERDGPSR